MSTTLHQSPSLQVEEPWYDPSPNPRTLCRGGILQQHSVHTRVMQRGNHTRRAETLGRMKHGRMVGEERRWKRDDVGREKKLRDKKGWQRTGLYAVSPLRHSTPIFNYT